MHLMHLELTPPACLTALNGEGELDCTLVRLAPASLTTTAAEQLASCIEEETAVAAAAKAATAASSPGPPVFALPLAPAFESECCNQLFVFGATVRACVSGCKIRAHACRLL